VAPASAIKSIEVPLPVLVVQRAAPEGVRGGADSTERAWLRLALLDGTPVTEAYSNDPALVQGGTMHVEAIPATPFAALNIPPRLASTSAEPLEEMRICPPGQ
jgi:hypothetical protein